MNFEQVINGVPLIFVVMGLVELTKSVGLTGKWLTVASFGIGLVIGIVYQLSLAIPVDFSGWIGAVFFGLGLGLVASKVYDSFTSASQRDNGVG